MSFHFYNPIPGDWLEGANEGHLYELCFAQAPSMGQRAAIAARYERDLAQGPAEPARKPWSWHGAVARFFVGERWTSQARAAFAQVARLVRAFDRISPLRYAAFLGAREASSWPPAPAAPPAVDHRAIDPSLPALVEDPAFELARTAARKELAAERIAVASRDAAGIDLVPFPDERVPHYWRDPIPDALLRAFEVPEPRFVMQTPSPGQRPWPKRMDGDHPRCDEPRGFAEVIRDGRVAGYAYLDDEGSRRLVEDLPDPLPTVKDVRLTADGRAAIAFVETTVYEIDFATGRARARWTSDDGAEGLALMEPLWVVKTSSALLVLDPRGEAVQVVARLKIAGTNLSVAIDGTVIATSAWQKGLKLVGYSNESLKELATINELYGEVHQIDGEIVGIQVVDGERRAYTIQGIPALYEAWAMTIRDDNAPQKRGTAPQKGGTATNRGATTKKRGTATNRGATTKKRGTATKKRGTARKRS